MKHLILTCTAVLMLTQLWSQSLKWVVNAHFPEDLLPQNPPGLVGSSCIVTDENENVYSSGVFVDFLYFGEEQPSLFSDSQAMYIMKTDSLGNILWLKSIGRLSPELFFSWIIPASIHIDGQDNIIINGNYNGYVDFDPSDDVYEMSTIQTNGFIMKLNEQGEFVWAHSFAATAQGQFDPIKKMLLDNSNNIYLSGEFIGTLLMDDEVIQSNSIGEPAKVHLTKLDSNGNLIWIRPIICTSTDSYFETFEIDNSNKINLVIRFKLEYTQTEVNAVEPYLENILPNYSYERLINFDLDGNYMDYIEIVNFPTNHGYFIESLNIDNEGDYIFKGILTGEVDFDNSDQSYILSPSSQFGHFNVILKTTSEGEFIWAKMFHALYLMDTAVLIDSESNLVIFTTIAGSIDFDPNEGNVTHTAPAYTNKNFIFSLKPNGDLRFVKQIPDNLNNTRFDLDQNDNLYTASTYWQDVDFNMLGSDTIISTNTTEVPCIILCKIKRDNCWSMFPYFSAYSDINCTDLTGSLSVDVFGGQPPFDIIWNTSPESSGSEIIVDSVGIYTAYITDAEGCNFTMSAFINGPVTLDSLDFRLDFLTTPLTTSVPGEVSTITARVQNDGCYPTMGTVKVKLDPITQFVQSTPAPTSIVNDTLFYSTNSLQYGSDPFLIVIIFLTDSLSEIGDSLCIYARVETSEIDIDLSNNERNFCTTVLASYDPNMKSVYPVGECEEHYVEIDQKLTYTVQFQNTGTFAAINIAVMDTLSLSLDINTLRVIHSSHDMITEVYDNHILKFKFPNIYLADSTSNEAESHGHIIFEIEPKSTIASGSVVENKVAIYFDYNQPIVTNTVFNTFVNSMPECIVNVDEIVSSDGNVLLYPNPTDDILKVVFKGNNSYRFQIRITDITGKVVVHHIHNASSSFILNTSELASGIYLLSVMNGNTVESVRFVKN